MPDNVTAEKRRLAEEAILALGLPVHNVRMAIVNSALDAYAALVCAEKDEQLVGLQQWREGIWRFLAGEEFGGSTDISESPSYGYGELDNNGFWEFPIPSSLVDMQHRMREAQAENARLREALERATKLPPLVHHNADPGDWCCNDD